MCTTPSRFMEELKIPTQRVNEKDNAINELARCLEQHALLILSFVARINLSQHPPIEPINDPPPRPSAVGVVGL